MESSSLNLSDDNTDELMWYFAIGAMMNPTSINLRSIHPLESQPGELLDHALHWFGATGAAEAIKAPGKSFHGVLHRVSTADMEKLDVIERAYDRQVGKAKLYCDNDDQEKIVNVTVYTRHNVERGSHIDNIPKQRYLEIIISGAEHYGVDPQYIQSVLKKQEFQPRTLPDQFRSLGGGSNNGDSDSDNELPLMTLEDIRTNYHGKDKQTPFCFTINGKVVRWVGDDEGKREWPRIFKDSGEMTISRITYDPKYGLPECTEDFTREHSANTENELYEYFHASGMMESWRVIGKIAQTYKDGNDSDGQEQEQQ